MSRKEWIEIKCPECGVKVKTTIWKSLNVSIDPKLKKDLMNGKINHFECDKCGCKAFVETDFLYHDMRKKFCVQYFPFKFVEHDGFFRNFTQNAKFRTGLTNIRRDIIPEYMKEIHVVFSMAELLRYVIFRNRLVKIKRRSHK